MDTTFVMTYLAIILTSAAMGQSAPLETQVAQNCAHSEDAFRCVQYIRNYDADTVTVSIPDVHPLIGREISVRVKGVDTPEIKGKTECEKQLASTAQKMVAGMLSTARQIDLVALERDKYFRVLSDVQFDGRSLSAYLLEQKLAYPYDGGAKSKIDWCKFINERNSQ